MASAAPDAKKTASDIAAAGAAAPESAGKAATGASLAAPAVALPTVQCSLCSNTYDTNNHQPKKLPSCSHTFCQQCLVRHAKKKRKKKRRFTCPDCGVQQNMEAYPNGVPDLPTERLRLDMLDDMLCKDCEKKSGKTKACENCQTPICENCALKHVTPHYCEVMAKVRNIREEFNDQFMKRCEQRLAQYDKIDLDSLRQKIVQTNDEIAAAIDKRHADLLEVVNQNERKTTAVKDTIRARDFVQKAYAMLDDSDNEVDLEALTKETLRVKESIAMVTEGKTKLEPLNLDNSDLMEKINAFDKPMLQAEINKQLASAEGGASASGGD